MTEELINKLEADATNIEKNLPNTSISTAYMCGVDSLRNNAWHNAKEEPEPGKEIIIKTPKGMKVYANAVKQLMAWDYFMRIARGTHWAYVENFCPTEFPEEKPSEEK